MGRILKHGNDYFVEFTGNGLRFQKKAGKTEEEALQKLKEIEQSLDDTALDIDLSTVTVDIFVQRFIAFSQEVYTSASRGRYNKALTHFTAFLKTHLEAEQYIKTITPRVMEEYKAELQKTFDATEVNFMLFLVRDILEYARTLRFLNDNPTQHLKFLAEGFSTTPEVLKHIPEGSEHKDIMEFVVATGIKKDEAAQLIWESFDWKERCLCIPYVYEDQVRTRRIPLDLKVLDYWQSLKGDDAEKVFVGRDLSDIPFEILQNTFAKNLLTRGVKLFHLNRFLGLEDIRDVYPFGVFLLESS